MQSHIDDVTNFEESPFQDGPIAQAVNDVSARGVLFFSSARNSGNKDDDISSTVGGRLFDGGDASFYDGAGSRYHAFDATNLTTDVTMTDRPRADLFGPTHSGAHSMITISLSSTTQETFFAARSIHKAVRRTLTKVWTCSTWASASSSLSFLAREDFSISIPDVANWVFSTGGMCARP